MTAYPHLFSPGRIGRLALGNRILMAPMEKNLAAPTGAVTQRYIDYCEARAAGGAALILLESTFVHPAGRNHRYQLGLHDDALVPGSRRLVDACHRHGALVGAQLEFAGRETSAAITGVEVVAPSAVPCTAITGGDVPRPLRVDEIHALVDAFAQAASRAVAAGFDTVEIHGAHGYLVGQFLSPYTNRRDDDYGSDFERRLRFPLDVIAAVRKAVGADVPVLYRLSADERVDGGLTIEDTCRIAPRLADPPPWRGVEGAAGRTRRVRHRRLRRAAHGVRRDAGGGRARPPPVTTACARSGPRCTDVQIPQKLVPLVSSLLMPTVMVGVVSGTLTAWNRGLSAQFLSQWLQAFAIAYCVALPTALVMAPIVRTLVA